jgi:hypothetical protein
MTRWLMVLLAAAGMVSAETKLERGKRVVDECLAALGGPTYLAMQNRVETGRAYSFYREKLQGFSIAKIYTRYTTVKDTAHDLAVRERELFGKKLDYGYLYGETEAYDVTFRGARPLPAERFDRYRESTLRSIFYILRVRLREPGMVFESRGADVLDNRPVEIVDIGDAENRITTVYFDQTTKLPTRQMFTKLDPKTREKDEEITLYSKYREVGGVQWPLAIERRRNGEKTFEIFSESVEINKNLHGDLFNLPTGTSILKAEER